MNILVRLPNWLGDIVMSSGFLNALALTYPDSTIDIIIKDSLKELVAFLPQVNNHFIFSRNQYKGLTGAARFGHYCALQKKYDLFFSLPDSFSSAVVGFFSRSRRRIGYSAELRSMLLTHAYKKPGDLHRAEEYIHLLQKFDSNKKVGCIVKLSFDNAVSCLTPHSEPLHGRLKILFNMHSAAQSRKIPQSKSISLCKLLINRFNCHLLFTGSAAEMEATMSVIAAINSPENCTDYSGKCNLVSLTQLCTKVDFVISSDSGIAHLANAAGKHVFVLFGAGNEKNTAPYNSQKCTVIRADGIPCAPCISNTCRYGHIHCMNLIDENKIIEAISTYLTKQL
ncbi:MAG: glycosyltransferase family 9 protein [Chitinispirillaceae bacterium]|nr:glycosyltransferase family 9 protein [Chitinispirillaceae bacterium]